MLLYLAAIHNSLEACWSNTCTRCSCRYKYLDKPDDPVSPSALAINVDPILSKVLHTESLLLHSVSVQQWFSTHSTGNCSLQRQQALITPLLWKSRHLLPPLLYFLTVYMPLSSSFHSFRWLICFVLSSFSRFRFSSSVFFSCFFFSSPVCFIVLEEEFKEVKDARMVEYGCFTQWNREQNTDSKK